MFNAHSERLRRLHWNIYLLKTQHLKGPKLPASSSLSSVTFNGWSKNTNHWKWRTLIQWKYKTVGHILIHPLTNTILPWSQCLIVKVEKSPHHARTTLRPLPSTPFGLNWNNDKFISYIKFSSKYSKGNQQNHNSKSLFSIINLFWRWNEFQTVQFRAIESFTVCGFALWATNKVLAVYLTVYI